MTDARPPPRTSSRRGGRAGAVRAAAHFASRFSRAGGVIAPLITTLSRSSWAASSSRDRQEPDQGLPRDLNGTGVGWFFHVGSHGAHPVLDRHMWFPGTRRRRAEPAADAAPHHADHPDGACRRVRVPLRHVQHRRPGPVLRRHDLRRLDRLVVRGMIRSLHVMLASSSARSPARRGRASPASSRRPSARTR